MVTVIGFTLWYSGVSVVPASTAGAFTGVIAISALLLSHVFLQEPLKWEYLAGGAFVLVGVYVTTRRPSDGAGDLRMAKASAPPSSTVDRG
ncbi:MAG: EamA family transporter [Bacilli bacterium]